MKQTWFFLYWSTDTCHLFHHFISYTPSGWQICVSSCATQVFKFVGPRSLPQCWRKKSKRSRRRQKNEHQSSSFLHYVLGSQRHSLNKGEVKENQDSPTRNYYKSCMREIVKALIIIKCFTCTWAGKACTLDAKPPSGTTPPSSAWRWRIFRSAVLDP